MSERRSRRKALVARTLCGAAWLFAGSTMLAAQTQESPEQALQRLSLAVQQAQAQVDASQQQLLEVRRSLAVLQEQMSHKAEARPDEATERAQAAESSSAQPVENERESMQDSQLATLNQAKVESSSKYPVSLHGLILLNGFYNNTAVDSAVIPAVVFPGDGTAGASLRQTSLGLDARGPTLAGATSHADVDVDFLGNLAQPLTATATGFVRLRTAHASLDWQRTRAFLQYDRPILNPEMPTSLVAVAQPSLAWSGNLWQWVPQIGVDHAVSLKGDYTLQIGAALIDVPDPPSLSTTASSLASQAERTRWPGSELRLGLSRGSGPAAASIGVGGYVSPHRLPDGANYKAWAATLDWHLPLPAGFSLSGNAYRGVALGGLGGGTYKDVIARSIGNTLQWRPLDNVGGWTQLKKKAGERLEFNATFGLDQAFAQQLRSYPVNQSLFYADLARNRTLMGNAIWSPSAALLFSFEYRRISSFPIASPQTSGNSFGLGAGYKF